MKVNLIKAVIVLVLLASATAMSLALTIVLLLSVVIAFDLTTISPTLLCGSIIISSLMLSMLFEYVRIIIMHKLDNHNSQVN